MSRKQKISLIKIILAAGLTAVIFILTKTCLTNEAWGALYALPYVIVGYDVLLGAAKNIIHGRVFDEKFLMTIATVGAFAVFEFAEAVAVMLFYQTGELFQSVAVGKSRRSIAALMDIRADSAVVLRDGIECKVAAEQVAKGEIIVVRPGERVALDGIIREGVTCVNTAALTGESLPCDKAVGDSVLSGSVNLNGVIKVQATGEYGESTVSKILELVENSAVKKSKTENFISRFAKYYTPAVVICAIVLAILPPLAFGGIWTDWINRALSFLVVSCPCALVISVPMSFFGGIGGASRSGILIKGANYLEMLSKVDAVVFDKTGTLTEGVFQVSAIHPQDVSEADLLDLVALAESYSTHPIAESIMRAHDGHIDKSRVKEVSEISGQGVRAVVDGAAVYVGNGKLMDSVNAAWHDCHLSGTTLHVAKGDKYLGHIIISDVVKKDAKEAIARLKQGGVRRTVMLTGDARSAAETVQAQTGIDEVKFGLMPLQKVEEVEKLLDNYTVAFVGDGINDAPVLTRADVGIAMGGLGSDAAIEAADIVLMDDKPSKLCRAIDVSRKTMGIVYQNIVLALSVKFIVLMLVAFGLASMWVAVFADVGVMILAVLNAMRALRSSVGSAKKVELSAADGR